MAEQLETILKEEYQCHIVDGSRELGDLGGASEPAINSGTVYWKLHQCVVETVWDHVEVLHEGIAEEASGTSGTSTSLSSAAADHTITLSLYRLPVGTRISELAAANKIADDLTIEGNVCDKLEFDLESSSSGTPRNATPFAEGDTLVIAVTAQPTDAAATTTDNMSVAWMGRALIRA